jgi:hypothetical protein
MQRDPSDAKYGGGLQCIDSIRVIEHPLSSGVTDRSEALMAREPATLIRTA